MHMTANEINTKQIGINGSSSNYNLWYTYLHSKLTFSYTGIILGSVLSKLKFCAGFASAMNGRCLLKNDLVCSVYFNSGPENKYHKWAKYNVEIVVYLQ